MTPSHRASETRDARVSVPTLADIFWGPLANRLRKIAEWRRRGFLGEALRAQRRSPMRFEALEPRILLSADLTHVTPPSVALDATLRVEDLGGAPILRLIDNPSSAILGEHLIDQDINVSIRGADQSDRLTIGFDRAALAHQIRVDFDGGEGSDELVGPDRANTWLLDGPGAGSLDGDRFTNLERVSGGAADDTFVVLDATVSTVVEGGAGTDTLAGADADNTWSVTGTDSGALNSQPFSGIEKLEGGGATDTLVGPDGETTWVISGENEGTVDTVSFSGMENLTGGAGNDTFIFAGGSISGTVDGGGGVNTFDYGSRNASVTVNLETGAASEVGALVNVTRFVGGAGSDTLVGRSEDSTWTVSGQNAGGVGTVEFSQIENVSGGAGADTFVLTADGSLDGSITGGLGIDSVVGPNSVNDWVVDGSDSGSLNGITFIDVESIFGGDDNDVITLLATGGLAGTASGGGGQDRLRGPDRKTVWRFNGNGGGDAGGTKFTGMESLEGGAGEDTLVGPGEDSTWTVDGANSGNVGGVAFSGMENLEGSADNQDTFVFDASGSLSGLLKGGDSGFDSIELAGGDFQNVVYNFSGIDSGSIEREAGNVITYSGFEPITSVPAVLPEPPAAGPATITLNYNVAGSQTITISGAGDAITVTSTAAEDVTFSRPTGTLTINASGNEDTIVIQSLGNFDGTLEINALGGDDTVDIQAITAAATYVIDGGADVSGDTVRATVSGNATLTDATLTIGSESISLGGTTEAAELNGTAAANTLTVSGWSGTAVLNGGDGNDTFQFDDDWGNVTVIELAGQGTDTLDFGPYSDVAPRDSITIVPSLSGALTINAEALDGSSVSLSATSADNLESLSNANIDLTGMADAPGDELVSGLNALVAFLRNLAAVGDFATSLPLLGGSADVAVAKLLGFAEAIDELRLEVEELFRDVPSITTDDLIAYLDGLFTGVGRNLTHLGASVLSPRALTDTDVVAGDTYAFNLALNGGSAIPISASGVDTVGDLVGALNAALIANAATNGVVVAVERAGRIAFQVVGNEVNSFATTALLGAAQNKLGFAGSPVSLANVQQILRGLDPLNVKLASGVTLGVEFASGTPQLRFDVNWRGTRESEFFYNLGTEAQGLGLAFDLDAKLTALSQLVLDVQLGLNLGGGDTTFFVDVDELRAGVEITSTAVTNAGINLGFLDVLASGSVTLDAGVTATLGDTDEITIGQLLIAPQTLGGLLSGGSLNLTGADGTGSPNFTLDLNLSVDAGLDSLGGFTATGSLAASGNPFTSGEDIDLTVNSDFTANFPSFNNLNAAGVISLIGQITGWLDGLRDGELIDSINIPFVEGGLDAILDLAEVLDDALLYDEGADNSKDGSDRLVSDLNQALAQAGLDSLIRAQGNGVTITLIAVDPEITGFSIAVKSGADADDDDGGFADLGFVNASAPTPSGGAPFTIVAPNDAVSRGRFAAGHDRAAFTVTVNKAGGPIVRDVLLAKEATDANEGIGDDVAKLINASNAPLFSTAQELAERLDQFIPGDVSFSASTKLLTYTISFTDVPLFTVELPVDFSLDLGEIAGVESNTRLVIESTGGFNFTLGFDLNQAPGGSSGPLTGGTTLDQLGVDVKLEEAAGANNAPRTIVGQLSGDATFEVSFGDDTVTSTTTSAGTAQTLNDNSLNFVTGAKVKVGDTVFNLTDGSKARVLAVAANSLTTTPLTGGTDNTWGSGDQYRTAHLVTVRALDGTPGTDINVTQRLGGQAETAIAVNPTDPMNMIIGANDNNATDGLFGSPSSNDSVWVTTDGGQNWTRTIIPLPTGGLAAHGDPTIVFDRTGRAVYAHLVHLSPEGLGADSAHGGSAANADDDHVLAVAVSTNKGASWTAHVITTVDADAFTDDKEYLAVGPDITNPDQDRFVVVWHERNVIYSSTSTDGGATWSAPVVVSNATAGSSTNLPRSDTAIDAVPAFGPNGEIYVVWENYSDVGVSKIMFDVSLDGGATWGLGGQETSVFFGTGDASLTNDDKTALDAFAALLNADTSIHVTIEGHTDTQGTSASNQTLSDERAQAVFDYLTGADATSPHSIAASRLTMLGFGEALLKVNTGDALNDAVAGTAEQNNRRVDLKIDRVIYSGNVNVFRDQFGGGLGLDGTDETNSPAGQGEYEIPAQPDRGVWMGVSMDVDRSGGANDGRIYLAFADQGDLDGLADSGSATDHHNLDIFVLTSDDLGASWSSVKRVNDDTTTRSQFFSWLDVDQANGNVALAWYDARLDDGGLGAGDFDGIANNEVAYFASFSTDGGQTWAANRQVSDGVSDGAAAGGNNFLDYTGVAFFGDTIHMAWADNSDSTGDNANGQFSALDVYYDRIRLTNETIGDLVADINLAIGELDALDGKIVAQAVGNKVKLVVVEPAVNELKITTNSADPAFRDLGIQVLTELAEANGDTLEFVSSRNAPTLVGRLTADASFQITLASGTPQTVTVSAAATAANRSILDLVKDVQDAIDAAFTPPGPGQHVIEVSSVGTRLLFTLTGAALAGAGDAFTITPGTNAAQLGITGAITSDEADLVVTRANGTTTHRVSLDIDKDMDGQLEQSDIDAITITDVINAIESATGTNVDVTITVDDPATPVNEAGTSLTLRDTTWASGSNFMVSATNGSLAAVQLGIIGKDGMPEGQAGEPDGKIIGAKIAGASLLDRVFITSSTPSSVIDATVSIKAALLVQDIIVDNPAGTVITSESFEFEAEHVGKQINIKGVNGFTVGTFTIDSVDEATNKATLSASIGDPGMTGGVGVLNTGVDASAHVGFVGIDLDSTAAKLGAELSLGFNTGATAWTNDSRLTLRELVDGLSDPLSLIAPPDWNPLTGETNFADLDLTVDISLDGASADFGALAGDLLGATPGVTIDVKALGDPFLGTRFRQANYAQQSATSFTVDGNFETKLPVGVVINFKQGATDHFVTVTSRSFSAGETTVNVTTEGGFALPTSLTGYDVTLQPKIDIDTSDVDLDNLLNFEDIDFADVLAALQALFNFLSGFEAFGFLNTDIPLINQSVNDLLGFASDFADDLDAAADNPASALQVLETKINEAVGLGAADLLDLFNALKDETNPADTVLGLATAPNDVVDLSLVDDTILKLDLSLGKTFSGGLDVAIPGIDFGDGVFAALGLGDVFDLSGSAGLFAQGSVMLRLQLGIDLENPGTFYLFEDTGLEADLSVGGENIAFRVGVGPFALSIASTEDETAAISISAGATLGIDDTVFDDDGKVAFATALSNLQIDFSGQATGLLPVFFPNDSNLIGEIRIGEAAGSGLGELENIGNLVIDTGAETPTSDDFVIDVSDIVGAIGNFNFDSFSIFDNIFLAIDGIDMALEFVENLVGGKIGDLSIPLVGDELAKGAKFIEDFRDDFIQPLRQGVENAQNVAQDFSNPDENIISKLLFNLLAPASVVDPNGIGLGLLKPLDGSFSAADDDSAADFITLNTNLDDFLFNPATTLTLGQVFIEWDFKLGTVLADLDTDIGFDLGIPGLGLETEGEITLDVEWDLDLGFGLSGSDGFYLKVDDQHELVFAVDVAIPAEITGTLGFLGLRASDKTIQVDGNDYNTHLGATFAVDIKENGATGADAQRLGFTEFGSIGLDAKIAADAAAALELELGLSPDLFVQLFGPGAADIISGFPKLKSDFIFLWEVGTRGSGLTLDERANNTTFEVLDASFGNAIAEGLKLVAFQDVRLDLGSFLSDVLGPLVDEVAKFTEPMQPLIDFITSPIPIIGDLGLDITWLDLAQMIAGDKLNVRLIEAIAEVITLINDIAEASDAGEIALPIGDMVLFDTDALLAGTPFTAANLWDGGMDLGGVFDQITAPGSGLLNDLVSAAGGIGDAIGDLISGGGLGGSEAQAAQTMQRVATGSGGFSFPFLETPSEIFGLLMGEPVDLIVYDLETDPTKSALEFEFEFSQFFSIFGPLGVSIGLLVEFTADGKFGYDTQGIQQFVETGFRNPLLLLNGFYIADDPKTDGSDDPELTFLAELQAAAELNLGIARAGVAAALGFLIEFDLFDPNDDMKIRIDELVGNIVNQLRAPSDAEKLLAPLAIFDVSGEIFARLFAFLKIDFGFFSFEREFPIFGPVTLLSFEVDFFRPPVLASEQDTGDLIINAGQFAKQRLLGNATDVAEHLVIRSTGTSGGYVNLEIKSGNSALGDDSQTFLPYRVRQGSKIIIDGGEGDDIFDLTGFSADGVLFDIDLGAGNDKLLWGDNLATVPVEPPTSAAVGPANKFSLIQGGSGDDFIQGSGGSDLIFGNSGNDTINAGGGADLSFGDEGEIGPGFARGLIKPTDGRDNVDGGGDSDIVFGGGGKDTVQGGSGAGTDLVLGGGGVVTFTSESGLQVFGNFEITGSVDGPEDLLFDASAGDNVLGGEGADILYGTAGPDIITGGDGDDIIFGLGGFDTIDAGGGDDVVFGDDGHMVPDGDDLNTDDDPVALAGGEADEIDGGSGADTIFGGGGADLIEGGAADDDIYGGSGADVIFGDSGSIVGGVPTPAEAGTDGGDLIFGEGEPDTIFGGGGNDVIDGGAGNDIVDGGSGADSIVTNKSNDLLDGGDGGDFYTVYFQGGTAASRMNIIDTGASGTDVFVALGTVFDDRFLLRANTDGSIAFVALINTPFHVERVNYSFVERIVVNGSFGDDYFASDDTAGEVTLNGEFGRDIFQIGQVFKSNRGDQTDFAAPFDFSDVTGVHVDDAFANIETTRGWLSNGISAPMTINGGVGDDLFTVFHNKAVLQLNGEEGDDTFEIRAFALAGSQEPQRERTDISGGAGADLVQYAVNAPVNIDGGDGFDTVIVIGTEFGDDLVITENGVFGAGLNVNFVRIESLRVDGAEGNDRFFVLSTSEKFMTEIFGGLGEDTFNMSGDTPPIVSNDLKGHSGLIVQGVESTDARYDEQSIFGISANVADNDEPFAVIRTSGGSTIITEGGSLVDSYQIVLTREPTKDVLVRALAPIPTPGDRERRAMAFRLNSSTRDELSADGTSLTLRFTSTNWWIPQTVDIYADDAPLTDTSVSAAFGLFTRPEIVGEDPDADLTTGIPFDMNDEALEGVRFGVVNHLVSAASDILEGTLAAVSNGAIPTVTISDGGIVSADEIVGRKLFIVAGKGAGQLRSVLAAVDNGATFTLTLDRPFLVSDVPTPTSEFFLAIDDALVGTVSAFDETPSGLPATTEPEDHRSTFTDSAALFPTAGQGLRGAVLEIIGGPGAGQQRLILGNDPSDPTHTLILNGPWREDPVAGQSLYRIERYDGLAIQSVTVQINDDDEAGVIVDEAQGFDDDGDATAEAADVVADYDTITTVIEGGDGDHLGEQDVLRIRLSRDPGAAVNVALGYASQLEVRDLSGNLISAANPLVFNSTNWDDFQIVRVTATDDTLREGFHSSLIQFNVTAGTADVTLEQTDGFNLITEENAVFFVGLSQNPVAGSTVVTLNGEVLTEGASITTAGADYVVLSNKVVFLDGTGDLQAVFGTISVTYDYVNAGFSSAFTAPVLVRINDADAPTVVVRESGGSTDVIELTSTGTGPDSIDNPFAHALIQAFNLSPWNDAYELVLTGQPRGGEVTITVSPEITKTTRTGGIRTDAIQLDISSDDGRVAAGPIAGQLTVTFDATNWDDPVLIKVRARDDAEVDGSDTQVFAPGPDTVSGILGPVFVDGAGGEGSLAMNAPLMLPGELNQREPDGDVIAFIANTTPGGTERMTVLTAALQARVTELGLASIDELIGLTVEMAAGNGVNVVLDDGGTPTPFDDKVFDRFWQITDIVDGAAGQKILHLQNPSQLNVAALPASAVPNASSKFAITTLSANFFVDETTQVDFMFVHDEDSPADSTGFLTATRLYGLNMGPDLVIGGQLRPGGVTFEDLEVLEVNLGKGNNTFNVLGTPTRSDGYQTWTFLNSGDETVPWFGVMGDTVNVALNATDQLVRNGTATAGMNPELVNGFKTTVTVDGPTFANDALAGYLISITGAGTGDAAAVGQTRRIIGNTGNVLWVDRPWEFQPNGQIYQIINQADGAFAVNAQGGDDTVNASASSLGIVMFGGLGDDTLTGGSGEDIIFGDRGRVDYFNEIDAIVTRLGDAPQPISGFVTAQVVNGTPGAGETDLFHLADSAATFPIPDELADGTGTDDIGLRGLFVDINNGFGFLQTIKRITNNTGTVLTIAGGFDPQVDLPGPVAGAESEYRISTYPEDQTDGVVRAPNLLITVDNDQGGADVIHAGSGADQIFGGAADDEIHAGAGDDLVVGDAGRLDRQRDPAAPGAPEIGDVVGSIRDRLRSIAFGDGGVDTIFGDAGADVIVGGFDGDILSGGTEADILIGDNGEIDFAVPSALVTHVFTTDTTATTGGADTVSGDAGSDVVLGGAAGDTLYGDNASGSSGVADLRDYLVGDNADVLLANNLITVIETTDTSELTGGDDTMSGNAGADHMMGGVGADTISGNGGSDVILGDQGTLEYNLASPFDGNPLTLDRARTKQTSLGGDDDIHGDALHDVIVGGAGGDVAHGDGGDDLIVGDFGEVRFGSVSVTQLGVTTPFTEYALHATITDNHLGGADTLYGDANEDVLVGGAFADNLDGGSQDDLIFGDNVTLDRNGAALSDFTNPRFRETAGALYDLQDNVQVGMAAQNIPVLTGTPVWGNWEMLLLDHDDETQANDADKAQDWNKFGADYIAGGAHDDQIFGQLGDDTIQGDGSIDSKVLHANPVAAARDGSLAGKAGLVEVGTLQVVASFEDDEDGHDYVEGNGGDDLIFGNLGQDDLVGGNSDLFSLGTPDRRPDAEDLVFGGAGTEILRNETGNVIDEGDTGNGRDADVIMGDNANVYRVVIGAGASLASTYASFVYDDTYGEQLIVRAPKLLDYDAGGPAFTSAANNDIGAGDELHGESGDDAIYGQRGRDVLFGEGQDDDLIGGYGNDWISGGTGNDGVIGDDGRVYTSRNSATVGEPLYGVLPFTGSNTKNIDGNVLGEQIATPGGIQQATINVGGELKKSVNLTPFSADPAWQGGIATADEFQAGLSAPHSSDDIIYGGLGGDWLHGATGDDAISGAEALPPFYGAPANAGDVLQYSPQSTTFFAYSDTDPRSAIDGFLLNFSHQEGPGVGTGFFTDGDDRIFGDTGNDWLVGGTGRDHLYGGWGNDLMNADDDHSTNGDANDTFDTHTTYEDLAYGGAGIDVLIGNTGGDRLIDWAGEFNSYIVPFAPFGEGTVTRMLQPQLPEFLYALSASDGADPTRLADLGASANAARKGEPWGELGLVLQQDDAWQEQTGAPRDTQPGNIPGGSRDVLRSAAFESGSTSGFFADSGTWTSSGGVLQVQATSLGGDAVSVFHVGDALPGYFELQASVMAIKPTSGWNANSYMIFDYQSKDNFKFAGLDVSLNKLVMGHRDASGWHVDKHSPILGGVKDGAYYNLLLAVNGVNATLLLDNKTLFTHTYQPRVVDGYSYGLNDGMVGVGSNNSRGAFDNIRVQVLPPQLTLDVTEDFVGEPVFGLDAASGAWSVSAGRFAFGVTPGASSGISVLDLGPDHLNASSYLALEAKVSTAGRAGFIFDRYDDGSFKYVAIDAAADKVVIGYYTPKRGWVDAATAAKPIGEGVDYTLAVSLKGTTVSVSLNGQALVGHAFYATTLDGRFGLLASGAQASFDDVRVKTNDPAFATTATGSNMLAAEPLLMTESASTLSQAKLDAVAAAAMSTWTDTLGDGDPRLAGFGSVQISVADLGGQALGYTEGSRIWIDTNAAGYGWSTTDQVQPGRMDLVTVITHELGNLIGLRDNDPLYAVMDEDLESGVRYAVGGSTLAAAPAASSAPTAAWRPAFDWDAGTGLGGWNGAVDWQGSASGGWNLQLSPYAPPKPAKAPAPSLAAFDAKLFKSEGFDKLGRALLGKGKTER